MNFPFKRLAELAVRFDIAVLQRTSQVLLFLHEWIDLRPLDVLRLFIIAKFVILFFQLLNAPRSMSLPITICLGSIWLAFCTMDWFYAEECTARQPDYNSGTRIVNWTLLFASPIATPVWAIFFFERLVIDAPKPPSQKGRRRKELLAKLEFRKFEPLPQT